jgi:phage terminase large subunit-like protein
MIAPKHNIPSDLVGYDPVATAGELVRTEGGKYYFDSGLYYSVGAADHAVNFIETFCSHVKGRWAGQPFILQPWQDVIIRSLFGWKRGDGTRRYRTAYIEIPRKNGKSMMAAAIALYLLIADGEQGGEVYCAASTREQASIIHRMAAGMIRRNKWLSQRCDIVDSTRRIVHPESGSFQRAVPAEAGALYGESPSGIVFDEVFVQKTRELWDSLQTGQAARSQPLTAAITTAGVRHDRHSICWELHSYAEKVRDGIIKDTAFLPVLYFADKDDDWTDPAVWRRANPNYGVSVSPEFLAAECQKAQETPGKENSFRQLHLCQWTEQEVRWLSMDRWDACYGSPEPTPLVEVESRLEDRDCFGGLDLASTTDVAAFVLSFPDEDGGTSLLPYFYVPKERARERERRDRVPYVEWARQGFLAMTGGATIDYDVIRRDINDLHTRFNIREIAADRWNAAQIINQLTQDGFEVVAHGQGFKDMTSPSKEFERLIVEGKLHHFGNPVLRWMASNVSAEIDAAGNVKPSKKTSIEKIDGIVAAIMAIGRGLVAEPEDSSVYEERGLTIL